MASVAGAVAGAADTDAATIVVAAAAVVVGFWVENALWNCTVLGLLVCPGQLLLGHVAPQRASGNFVRKGDLGRGVIASNDSLHRHSHRRQVRLHMPTHVLL